MGSTIPASSTSEDTLTGDSHLPAIPYRRKAFYEGGHQLEKLEFALAIAETKGDEKKSAVLRSKIADLGGNIEEPGT